MAEYIEREKLVDAIEGINWYKYNDEGRLTQGDTSHDKMFLPYTAVEGTIKSIPAADVREVIYCRDCIHYKPQQKSARWSSTIPMCSRSATIKMPPDGFCSFGEKREES